MDNEIYSPPKSDLNENSETELPLASRWARLGGSLIDTVILFIALFPVVKLTGYWAELTSGEISVSTSFAMLIIGLVVYFLLNGYLLMKRGQTIGKVLVKTRVVSVKDEQILPISRYILLRYLPIAFASQIPFIGQFLGLIDSLFIFRSDKRCVHDLIAGSKVVVAR